MWQHGFDAIREIGRIALIARFAVERRTWRDVMGHIGYSHPDHPAVRIGGVFVLMGIDGVVVVLGVRGVDGDEGEIAQVGALA